ncbi:MAG TPA: alpha/beta fold hydrolase [Egibacteraceae bacterium]|nr:alpha/beta fold hydrolase [Egibacteraceae bacterium]
MLQLVQEHFAPPHDLARARDEPLVVHQRSQPTQNRSLVVLVHGLGGRRYGSKATWGRFPELLFEDLPDVDVGLYEYRTLLGRLKLSQSVELETEAEVLAGVLHGATAYRNVVLVGHSMGGLLCKAAVRYLVETDQFEHPSLIAGLIFMATPQAGSVRVPGITSLISRDARVLRSHGPLVKATDRLFTDRLVLDDSTPPQGRLSLPTWAVLGSSDFWVDDFSARLGLPTSRTLRVRGSHTSLVKPKDRHADGFRYVADRVREALQRKATAADELALEDAPLRDPLPAAGLLIDRTAPLEDLRLFLTAPAGRLLILQGPSGMGKTALVAAAVERHRRDFDDVLWIECRRGRDSAGLLLRRLHALFSDNADSSLEGLWQNVDAQRLERPVSALLAALNRKSYLLIFDDLQQWLNGDGRVSDEGVGHILLALATHHHSSKEIILTAARTSLDPDGLSAPIGAIAEHHLAGLERADAIELLRAAGLGSIDGVLLDEVAERANGVPAALRIYANLVVRQHQDPRAILDRLDVEASMDELTGQAVADLPEEALRALRLLSLFRLPVSLQRAEQIGGVRQRDVRLLADRFLVELDVASGTVAPTESARGFALRTLSEPERAQLHGLAASYYAAQPRPDRPRRVEDVQAGLEEAYHSRLAGDLEAAASALVWAGRHLLIWGYADLVEREAEDLLRASS